MKKIPFQELLRSHVPFQEELEEAALRVLRSGRYILGDEVERFEEEFAAFCKKRHCISVGNGLDALRIALEGGIPELSPGDEVIVPAQTYIATWLAVTQCGMVPVAVDVDLQSGCLDPRLVEEAITPRTKAIVAVHLFGFAAALEPLRAIADRHGLFLLEDGAQAHGHSAIGGGDATAYSFYPTKNLGALGDGGAIITDNDALAERARQLRNYGKGDSGESVAAGWNSRLDELQAALLQVKLSHLNEAIERRREMAEFYLRNIVHPEITLPSLGLSPEEAAQAGVWHLFPIRSVRREALQLHLAARGIETLIHYPLLPEEQRVYAAAPTSFRRASATPHAKVWAATELSLPLHTGISDRELQMIVEGCNAF